MNILFFYFSGQGLSVLPFPYYGGMPWGMYPGLVQQQQQQSQQNGGSGSNTPGPNGRRPGSPSSGATTNGTVTPGPPELQNGGPATNGGQVPIAGVTHTPMSFFPAAAHYIHNGPNPLRGPTPPQGAAALHLGKVSHKIK